MGPKISVLMCAKNAGSTLGRAIRSIQWQTVTDWELLILDDGSSDDTQEKVGDNITDSRVRWFSREVSSGLPSGLNFLLQQAKGEYIARMDADDISFPQRFKVQLEYLETHKAVDLLASSVVMFDQNLKALGKLPVIESHEDIAKRANQGLVMPHPTWMGRKEWFLRNRYNDFLLRGQDQELLQRTVKDSCFYCMKQPLLGYSQADMTLFKHLRGRFWQVQFRYLYGANIFEFLYALAGHSLKAGIDTLIFCAGMKSRFFQKWRLPLSADEQQAWNSHIKELQDA